MAYERIYDRWSTEWTFVADSDADATAAFTENPEAPVGSWALALNNGAIKVHVKSPTGSIVAAGE